MDLQRGFGAEVRDKFVKEVIRLEEEEHAAEEARLRQLDAERQREAVKAYMLFPRTGVYHLRSTRWLPIGDLPKEVIEQRIIRDYPLAVEPDDEQRGIAELRLRTEVIEADYLLSVVLISPAGRSVVAGMCVIKSNLNPAIDGDGIMVDDGEQGGLCRPDDDRRKEIRAIILEACRLANVVPEGYDDVDPREQSTVEAE